MNLFLRDESNPVFIAGTLKSIKEKKISCLLWQNAGGKRLVTKGMIFDINFGAQVLSLNPIGDNFLFNSEADLFFQCEYKHLLFKSKVSFANRSTLMMKLPKVAKALESRSEQRFSLLNDKHPIDMVILKFKTYETSPIEVSYRACDVSNGGGSFFITTGSLTKFHIDDKIMVKAVGQDVFTDPVPARLRSITQVVNPKSSSVGQHRVGFQFDARMDVSGLRAIKMAMS